MLGGGLDETAMIGTEGSFSGVSTTVVCWSVMPLDKTLPWGGINGGWWV